MTQNLHERALALSKEFRRVEAELTEVLRQIDEKKIFRNLGYGSLFDYATRALGLTESVAYGFISVARKSKDVPELKAAIESGSLSVSQAKRVTSVITRDNAQDLIQKARSLTQREIEKEVAILNPKTATPDRINYVTETHVEIRFGASEDLIKKLKRAQDLVSQKTRKHANYETVMEAALDQFLEKNDPVKKAARLHMKNSTEPMTQGSIKPSSRKARRAAVSAATKHKIFLRDQGRCTFVGKNGTRCTSERWIEVHHIFPVSQGGKNTEDNLETLCFTHHKAVHSH